MLRIKLKLDNFGETPQYELQNNEFQPIATTNEPQTSRYFFQDLLSTENTISSTFLEYEQQLNLKLKELSFDKPVAYVYSPLEYAFEPHAAFIHKYCDSEKPILFLGMNPGPWGMCQTGVPFGEVKMTTEWLDITGPVFKPTVECPKKEIAGFGCHRSEESGKRFYGLFKDICGTPENFFRYAFVYNLCPLAMMAEGSANITPQAIKGGTKKKLEIYCGDTLFKVLQLLRTGIIVTLGRYTETQVLNVLKRYRVENIRVIYMPHPSPRVVGNENWSEKAIKVLNDNYLMQYFAH